ncbi:MAG: hypothetical protein NTZ83_03420 [Candidatus Pacearchaeota archaeon]|nr:hypothetical protein [Candidatus Pacearchaeota archaeon]
MKIYQEQGIGTEKDIRSGTIGSYFYISSAEILPESYSKPGALSLGLARFTNIREAKYHYEIRKELQDEFLSDMNIKEGKIEKLVGKRVVGFYRNKKVGRIGII